MPWKNTTTMEQKIEFICEWRTNKYTITELCKAFEISRPTAYKLIDRYEKQGIEGLRERAKKPINHPNRTKDYIEGNILDLKKSIQSGELKKYTDCCLTSVAQRTYHQWLLYTTSSPKTVWFALRKG